MQERDVSSGLTKPDFFLIICGTTAQYVIPAQTGLLTI
jgi:hypothetical protein